MIHTYSWLVSVVAFVAALFISKKLMLRVGMRANWFTNLAALLYAMAAVFAVLQGFAYFYPTQFWPNYGLFGFLIFLAPLHMVVFGARSLAAQVVK
jgi:hypothetical protein